MNVLFVCTGNTCRSPMAQAIWQSLTDEAAESAGLAVFAPEPIADNAVKALETFGVSGFSHLSAQITEEKIAWADRIFTMTRAHRDALLRLFPQAADKVFLLGDGDISDPFGGNEQVYLACCREIETAIRARLEGEGAQ